MGRQYMTNKETKRELVNIARGLQKVSEEILERDLGQELAYAISDDAEYMLELLGEFKSEEGAYNEPS